MIQKQLTISNQLGLHARASMKLNDLANQFESTIYIQANSSKINAKDILEIMSLAASVGTTITLLCDGRDESSAIQAISDLINRKFDEE